MAAPRFLQGMLSHCARFASGVWTAFTRRRLMAELSALDDHMLRDIGVSRHDVMSALAEPLFRDPTVQLVKRAAESRSAMRAQARERLATAGLMTRQTVAQRTA